MLCRFYYYYRSSKLERVNEFLSVAHVSLDTFVLETTAHLCAVGENDTLRIHYLQCLTRLNETRGADLEHSLERTTINKLHSTLNAFILPGAPFHPSMPVRNKVCVFIIPGIIWRFLANNFRQEKLWQYYFLTVSGQGLQSMVCSHCYVLITGCMSLGICFSILLIHCTVLYHSEGATQLGTSLFLVFTVYTTVLKLFSDDCSMLQKRIIKMYYWKTKHPCHFVFNAYLTTALIRNKKSLLLLFVLWFY